MIGPCPVCERSRRLRPIPEGWVPDGETADPWCASCIADGPPATDAELASDQPEWLAEALRTCYNDLTSEREKR